MSLGVRWGLGHSTGLIVIATLFISLKGNLDLRRIGRFCDVILGIFMIAIGLSGIIGAFKMSAERRKKRDVDLPKPSPSSSPPPSFSSKDGSSRDAVASGNATSGTQPANLSYKPNCESSLSVPSKDIETNDSHHEEFHDDCCGLLSPGSSSSTLIDMRDPLTQKVVSFSIGILHGAAGPGAILGVLPAVEMQSLAASSTYLGSFVVSSTISMGVFAALYGEVTKRLGSQADYIEVGLRVFSCSLSVVVGSMWLVLSLMGKLEEFFH
jgi:hypothetical protein